MSDKQSGAMMTLLLEILGPRLAFIARDTAQDAHRIPGTFWLALPLGCFLICCARRRLVRCSCNKDKRTTRKRRVEGGGPWTVRAVAESYFRKHRLLFADDRKTETVHIADPDLTPCSKCRLTSSLRRRGGELAGGKEEGLKIFRNRRHRDRPSGRSSCIERGPGPGKARGPCRGRGSG